MLEITSIISSVAAIVLAAAGLAVVRTGSRLRSAVDLWISRPATPELVPSPAVPDMLISRAAGRRGIALTAGARAVLSWPIAEAYLADPRTDLSALESSIESIFDEILEDPDPRDQRNERGQVRVASSLSVLRGISRRFCSIPPFCRRVEGQR